MGLYKKGRLNRMYLAISGNIGSGKSSLTQMLSERYALTPVYESVSENPYLEDFYKDMTRQDTTTGRGEPVRYSFHSQVFFLAKRLEQHLGVVNLGADVVQDRTVFEDAGIFARNLFASGNMDSRDWSTYQALYAGILPALRTPDLLVHIEASLPTLRARIASRGRDFEQGISDEYLERLNWLYREWVEGYSHSSTVKIDGDTQDFVHDSAAFADICSRIEAAGLHLPLLRSSTD
jgi:deoxyadenosine/deoxycytidine kinase